MTLSLNRLLTDRLPFTVFPEDSVAILERRLWPRLGQIEHFASEVQIKVFPTGERRVAKDPTPAVILKAFEELGTKSAVAAAFGVDRNVVGRWMRKYGLNLESRPEIRHANFVHNVLQAEGDRIRVAQWVTDEGSVGVTYNAGTDLTSLLVCGEMNDCEAISVVSSILHTPCDGAKNPSPTSLPLLGVRMTSAKAYALLEVLIPHMYGLKAMEARAALEFFPRSGNLTGRHTSDEFLTPVWKEFASKSIRGWGETRRRKPAESEVEALARAWVQGRIRRARRFIDPQNLGGGPVPSPASV